MNFGGNYFDENGSIYQKIFTGKKHLYSEPVIYRENGVLMPEKQIQIISYAPVTYQVRQLRWESGKIIKTWNAICGGGT